MSLLGGVDDNTSQVEKRKQEAKCRDAIYLKKDLNPGRTCSKASQCKSRDCREVCVGYEIGEACHKNEDCVEGAYCKDSADWPYSTTCQKFIDDDEDEDAEPKDVYDEECSDDYQCKITHYCWFATKEGKAANKKKCMKMYSQENGTKFGWSGEKKLADYTHNGKFCKSGLAFNVAPNES